MPQARTEMQAAANNFDRDLYRLLCNASDFATNGPREHRAKWGRIAELLHEARPTVRQMMCREDCLQTIGGL